MNGWMDGWMDNKFIIPPEGKQPSSSGRHRIRYNAIKIQNNIIKKLC